MSAPIIENAQQLVTDLTEAGHTEAAEMAAARVVYAPSVDSLSVEDEARIEQIRWFLQSFPAFTKDVETLLASVSPEGTQ